MNRLFSYGREDTCKANYYGGINWHCVGFAVYTKVTRNKTYVFFPNCMETSKSQNLFKLVYCGDQ